MATAKTEVIKVQIDGEVREANAEEIEIIRAIQSEAAATQAASAAARQSALAKLAELGLTDDEIAAL